MARTVKPGQIVYTRREMDWVAIQDKRRANVINALGILGQSGGPRQGRRNALAGLWDVSVMAEIVAEIDDEWRRVRALLLDGSEAAEAVYARGRAGTGKKRNPARLRGFKFGGRSASITR